MTPAQALEFGMLRDMQRTLRLYEVMARNVFYWRLRVRIIARMEEIAMQANTEVGA